MIRKYLVVSMLALVLCREAASKGAASAQGSEYAFLKSLPAGRLSVLTAGGKPDSAGLVGLNRGGWIEVALQRGAMWYLINAVVAGDRSEEDRAWSAVDVAFAHQEKDGGFDARPTPERPTEQSSQTFRVQNAFFFVQELAHAILVIEESPEGARFQGRIARIQDGLRRAAQFIDAGYDTIIQNSSRGPNRLFIAAKALGMSGRILNDPKLIATAHRLVREALSHRDQDGVFIEYGGRDSSYNLVSVLFGEQLTMQLPFPELDSAFDGAVKWELSRILPSGEVLVAGNSRTGVGKENYMGHPKGVNNVEVVLALTYYGTIHKDAASLAAADRVFGRIELKKN